jgi:hypothetical protein
MSVLSVRITGYTHLIVETTKDFDESRLLVPKVINLTELPSTNTETRKFGIETETGESDYVWGKLRNKFPL